MPRQTNLNLKNASHSLPDFTGTTIVDGRFLLMQELGSGSYGKVYKSIDTATAGISPMKYYAVKCLMRFESGSRQENAQLNELHLHSGIRDLAHIVQFCGAHSDDSHVYVFLDYCGGGDLFDAIVRKRRYHLDDALIKYSFLQIIDGLGGCHERGVFHRDLKPENILLSNDGSSVYISDFGLATSERNSFEWKCGTAAYMSPANSNGREGLPPYSTRHNDIWALGSILVNMITARNPWRSTDESDRSFSSFCSKTNYLPSIIPISCSVNAILKRIFAIHPSRQITLPELRTRILGVGSFYMSDGEMALAGSAVQRIIRASSVIGAAQVDSTHSESDSDYSSSDDDEVDILSTPDASIHPVEIDDGDIPELEDEEELDLDLDLDLDLGGETPKGEFREKFARAMDDLEGLRAGSHPWFTSSWATTTTL